MQIFSSLFGAAFTLLTAYSIGTLILRRRPAPPEIALALGAIVASFIVFLLLLANAAHWGAFLATGIVAIAAAVWKAGWRRLGRPEAHLTVFLGYGIWYFVNALAPEITPDGFTYHLGLPREYLR